LLLALNMLVLSFILLTFGHSLVYAMNADYIFKHTMFNITEFNQTITIAEDATESRLDYLRKQLTKPAKVVKLTGPIVSNHNFPLYICG
jgi:hypothetical protein